MPIFLKNCRAEHKNHSFLAHWPDWELMPEADLSVHRFLDCSVPRRPLVGLRPPSKIPSFSHSTSLCLPYLSPDAGALSLWQSQPIWVYGMVRVPRDRDCTHLVDCSLLSRSKNSQRSRNFPSEWEEKHSEMIIKYELETQKYISWCVRGYGDTTCSSLVVHLTYSCPFSLISHQLQLKSLYFSLLLCEGWI